MISNKNTQPDLIPGSRWVSLNGSNTVTAHVHSLAVEKEHERVFFSVEHRPGEMLNCYAGAFRARYTPVVE